MPKNKGYYCDDDVEYADFHSALMTHDKVFERGAATGFGAGMRLIERFTRVDADRLDYEFTVDDPTTFTRPWTVSTPMTRTDGPLFEYACHEGNYALRGILAGARVTERAAEQAAGKQRR